MADWTSPRRQWRIAARLRTLHRNVPCAAGFARACGVTNPPRRRFGSLLPWNWARRQCVLITRARNPRSLSAGQHRPGKSHLEAAVEGRGPVNVRPNVDACDCKPAPAIKGHAFTARSSWFTQGSHGERAAPRQWAIGLRRPGFLGPAPPSARRRWRRAAAGRPWRWTGPARRRGRMVLAEARQDRRQVLDADHLAGADPQAAADPPARALAVRSSAAAVAASVPA